MVSVVKKCSIPIHKKCSISLDFVIRDQYYCCHDCYLGELMTGDGFPYKFVTFHKNEEYFCFLQIYDTNKEMLLVFFQIIVGTKFPSSQDYGTKLTYSGKIIPQETIIKDVSQTKKNNNVIFIMRHKLKLVRRKESKKLEISREIY